MNNDIRVDKNMIFSKETINVPIRYRAEYRIPMILLVLYHNCTGKKSSIQKLHMITWSLESEKFDELLSFAKADSYLKEVFWEIDPVLDRALNLAITLNYVVFVRKVSGYSIKISEKGLELVSVILSNGIFNKETTFLQKLGRTITDIKIENYYKLRR